jgi:hypothetical protein
MVTYESLLSGDVDWAFREGSRHFEKESAVHKSLHRITKHLAEFGIPYAIAGGMALFYHGYRRFTEDIDIVVTSAGLTQIHEQLEGLGYIALFAGSRGLRDAESGVRIEFLVAGEYPGDGRPKSVAFPDPAAVGVAVEGMCFLRLATLVELKLAAGITSPRRTRDLADVQELIGLLGLPEEFADQLHPFVRAKYRELWQVIRDNPEQP